MYRRTLLAAVVGAIGWPVDVSAAAPRVRTILGTGTPGAGDTEVANPYGLVFGPDRALYFCDLDNQRIRRFDVRRGRVSTVAGNGTRGYAGDGGAATAAALNMPHEIVFDRVGHGRGDARRGQRAASAVRILTPGALLQGTIAEGIRASIVATRPSR